MTTTVVRSLLLTPQRHEAARCRLLWLIRSVERCFTTQQRISIISARSNLDAKSFEAAVGFVVFWVEFRHQFKVEVATLFDVQAAAKRSCRNASAVLLCFELCLLTGSIRSICMPRQHERFGTVSSTLVLWHFARENHDCSLVCKYFAEIRGLWFEAHHNLAVLHRRLVVASR